MKDLIKTPEIKPKKKILPYIFKKPSSLKNEKDKIQEICKKLYGHKILKECTKYKAVQKLLEIQTEHVDAWGVSILEKQLKQLSTLAKFNKTKSSTEYNFYTKLENILRTLFLEKGEPFWHRMFKSTGDTPHNILKDLCHTGWCYVAKREIPDIWRHCLLNDLGLFSQEENKKVVCIIGAFLKFRILPEVQYI
jgi:hypothetical protein|tara:strand:- start:48 stop:626 length:579 start_codon:yes stop_codon:yes gene_type:complete